MPKKLLNSATLPTLAQERLDTWGRCIHTQRLRQRITAADLCARTSSRWFLVDAQRARCAEWSEAIPAQVLALI